MSNCPFCAPDPGRVFHESDLVLGVWDAYPVSPGHALLVTRRHVATWIQSYRARRRPAPVAEAVAPLEPAEPPPRPNEVQLEALEALSRTRNEGNTAGLVVLATGLGKTWLSAFDSDRPEFRRVLFVAHREEILGQAMKTFRRVRPTATIGRYDGSNRDADTDVLFGPSRDWWRLRSRVRAGVCCTCRRCGKVGTPCASMATTSC